LVFDGEAGGSDASADSHVDLAPDLRDLLASHKLASPFNGPEDFVFPNQLGLRRDRHNVRTRVLYPAIHRADAVLAAEDRPPISPDVTFHSLRSTYASLLVEAGADPSYLKGQIGHRSAKLTLERFTPTWATVVTPRMSAWEPCSGALKRHKWTAGPCETPGEPADAAAEISHLQDTLADGR
jgi:hypothetical protein